MLFEVILYSFLLQLENPCSSALETKPGLQHRTVGFSPIFLAGNHTAFLVLLPLLWKPVPQDYAPKEKELGGDLGQGEAHDERHSTALLLIRRMCVWKAAVFIYLFNFFVKLAKGLQIKNITIENQNDFGGLKLDRLYSGIGPGHAVINQMKIFFLIRRKFTRVLRGFIWVGTRKFSNRILMNMIFLKKKECCDHC